MSAKLEKLPHKNNSDSQSAANSSFTSGLATEKKTKISDRRSITFQNKNLIQTINSESNKASQLALSKDLKPGELNVVGEEHDEKDENRVKDESEYLNKEYGIPGYWQEHQFQYRDGIGGFFSRNKTGDDLYAKVKWLFSEIQSAFVKYKQAIEILDQKELVSNYKYLRELIPNVWSNILHLKIGETSEARIIAKEIYDINERSPDFPKMLSDHQKIASQLNAHVKYLDKIPSKLLPQSDETSEKLKDTRDKHMHDAANKAKHQYSGVWKIGEGHVDGIEANYKSTIDYNLVHKDDFDPDFNKWRKKKNATKEK